MQELAPKAWQYGVLGVVALAFAWAIVHLWRATRTDAQSAVEREKAFEKERSEWRVREAKLLDEITKRDDDLDRKEVDIRAEYERKHRELVDHYAQLARNERQENRTHEDRVRNEFGEIVEGIEVEARKSADALVALMQKFYERFVGPNRPRY